jgi:hypothetical protein
LQIFSRADPEETREVAEDLERVYWVWTQLFFPLWESRHQVAVQLGTRAPGQDVVQHLAGQSSRLATRRKLRVVLLRDAQDYARTLGRSVPGIEQSTGFYSDERRTSFFYPAPGADAVASRRHELVHQLFREATDSRLRGDSPGMASGFWLVEGIAGYFESLAFKAGRVTVGGWDSPRLQFTRHRVFGRREVVAFADLASGGRDEVQRRGDLARFYTFAIGYTHLLMDGDSLAARRWVYARLAELYDIEVEIPDAETPESIERALVDFLRVDDEHLSDHPSSRPLRQLCLAGCQVSGRGLAALARAPRLQWLDLSGLPVDGEDLRRLVPQPTALRQLSLEATRVDDSLADWIGAARELEEVDLSATACGDATVARLAELPALRTLWLTGSAVTDVCVPRIDQMDALRTLDLQDTAISAAALARLKVKHPSWNINPL